MSLNTKIIAFGIISGLIWSMIVIGLHFYDSASDAVLAILAGCLTGLIVSMILKFPLIKFGPWWTLVFGLIALPLGAFIYGLVFSLFEFSEVSSGPNGDIFMSAFNVFAVGGEMALISVLTLYFLFPLSILTTFTLRFIIRSSKRAA